MPDFQKIIEAFKLEAIRLNQEAARESFEPSQNDPEETPNNK